MIIFKPKGYKVPKSNTLAKELRLERAKEMGLFGQAVKIDALKQKESNMYEEKDEGYV